MKTGEAGLTVPCLGCTHKRTQLCFSQPCCLSLSLRGSVSVSQESGVGTPSILPAPGS